MPRLELNQKKGKARVGDIERGGARGARHADLPEMERRRGRCVGDMFWASPDSGLSGSSGVEGAANEVSEASTPSSFTMLL